MCGKQCASLHRPNSWRDNWVIFISLQIYIFFFVINSVFCLWNVRFTFTWTFFMAQLIDELHYISSRHTIRKQGTLLLVVSLDKLNTAGARTAIFSCWIFLLTSRHGLYNKKHGVANMKFRCTNAVCKVSSDLCIDRTLCHWLPSSDRAWLHH